MGPFGWFAKEQPGSKSIEVQPKAAAPAVPEKPMEERVQLWMNMIDRLFADADLYSEDEFLAEIKDITERLETGKGKDLPDEKKTEIKNHLEEKRRTFYGENIAEKLPLILNAKNLPELTAEIRALMDGMNFSKETIAKYHEAQKNKLLELAREVLKELKTEAEIFDFKHTLVEGNWPEAFGSNWILLMNEMREKAAFIRTAKTVAEPVTGTPPMIDFSQMDIRPGSDSAAWIDKEPFPQKSFIQPEPKPNF